MVISLNLARLQFYLGASNVIKCFLSVPWIESCSHSPKYEHLSLFLLYLHLQL